MTDIIVHQSNELAQVDLDTVLTPLLYSLSDSSKRKYQHTFEMWKDFCADHGIQLYNFSANNLVLFFESMDASHSTKKNRLSHIRRLIQTIHAAMPGNEAIQSMYLQAKILKIKRNSSDKESTRNKTALTKKEVYEALNVWQGTDPMELRNRAIIAILFYCGLRRSECASLKWSDINFEEELLTVRHGKGDKERTIPILGEAEVINALEAWRERCAGREYIFCQVYKSGRLGDDTSVTPQAIYNVVQKTSDSINKKFAPHDARRTLITQALVSGSGVRDIQFIAGHSRPETTLGYAQVKDAKEVKSRIKLKY